jgi:hypothetical protein
MAALTAAAGPPHSPAAPQAARESTDEPAAFAPNHPEEVARPTPSFFSAEEMAALRRLADALVPRTRSPGALDAGAPEFLDFYLSQSDPGRQALYRRGLARLSGVADIEPLLAPLKQRWTPVAPADPFAAFLRAAKEDLIRATFNSRAWTAAGEGRRRSTGADYWYPVE